jgi:hypothetical protein
MSPPDSIALAVSAMAEGLEAILVGGQAVNAHDYFRTTADVDLMIRERETNKWRAFFEANGYRVFHATTNFIRLQFAADPKRTLPVDLMLADDATFEKITQQSELCDVSEGAQLRVPKPLHLIAMKLHALKSRSRAERGIDLQDVIHLIKTAKIDVGSADFAAILNRYAGEEIRAKLLREVGS